uniref:Uncharacterized protein n=1 Tax=Vespula pensylvanica TaxID=30213 RepID=A0A834PFQ5_VESPE|nr:hypothetical protein H0235_001066 [Vespula pensylvanica]
MKNRITLGLMSLMSIISDHLHPSPAVVPSTHLTCTNRVNCVRDGLRKGEERTALTATTTTATTIAMPRSHLDIFRKTDYFLVTSLGPLIDSSLHGILTNGPLGSTTVLRRKSDPLEFLLEHIDTIKRIRNPNGKDYDRLYRMDIRGEVPRTRVKYQSKVLELRYKISGLQILRLSTLSPGPVCLRNNSVRSKTHWLHRGY